MNCNARLRELKAMLSWIAYGMNCARAHYGGKSFFITKYCFALGDFSTHFVWSKWRYSFITTTKFALADFISSSCGRFHPRSGFHPSRTDFIAKPLLHLWTNFTCNANFTIDSGFHPSRTDFISPALLICSGESGRVRGKFWRSRGWCGLLLRDRFLLKASR